MKIKNLNEKLYKINIDEDFETSEIEVSDSDIHRYLDLKYDICEKGPEGCKQASDDFKLLKYSLGLTWDVVKSFFGYVKDLTLPKIQSWYESFKG